MQIKRAVLGNQDREMAAIRALCEGAGVEVVQATAPGPGGEPVAVGGITTYKATQPAPLAGDMWVECAPAAGGKEAIAAAGAMLVDHHEQGDPGYGTPPMLAPEASSLGQVLRLLDARLRTIAALDHAPTAAFAGLVPGVTRDEVLAVRLPAVAAFEQRPLAELQAEVESALHKLDSAPAVEIGGVLVADLRSLGENVPGVRHAGLLAGRAYVALAREKSGRLKCVLGGDGPGTATNGYAAAGFKSWAESYGYVDAYGGDAARGFAGAYVNE